MSKELKELYLLQKNELIKILNQWDPYALVSQGAPEDELKPEAALILSQLNKTQSIEEITTLVSNVFTDQFEDKVFDSENCTVVADKIYECWKNRNWF